MLHWDASKVSVVLYVLSIADIYRATVYTSYYMSQCSVMVASANINEQPILKTIMLFSSMVARADNEQLITQPHVGDRWQV